MGIEETIKVCINGQKPQAGELDNEVICSISDQPNFDCPYASPKAIYLTITRYDVELDTQLRFCNRYGLE